MRAWGLRQDHKGSRSRKTALVTVVVGVVAVCVIYCRYSLSVACDPTPVGSTLEVGRDVPSVTTPGVKRLLLRLRVSPIH